MEFVAALNFILVLFFVLNLAECSDIPSKISRCKIEDSECLKDSWNKYIKLAGGTNGLPEFDVPSLHNLLVPHATISPGNGPLDIVLKFRNANVAGLDDLVIDKISGFLNDPKDMQKFEIKGHCPLISVKGKYNVKGKVLLLPVVGDDEGEVKLYNIKYNITVLTSTKTIEGKEFLVISKVLCSYISEKNYYQFENLLNNKELSDGINDILNGNQDIINNEVRKPVGKVIAEIFKGFFISAFDKYPYSSFFL